MKPTIVRLLLVVSLVLTMVAHIPLPTSQAATETTPAPTADVPTQEQHIINAAPLAYTVTDSNGAGGPTYEWIAATTGEFLFQDIDEGPKRVYLPFDFDLYGRTSREIWVASNGGVVTFGNRDTSSNENYHNPSIYSGVAGYNMADSPAFWRNPTYLIAPLWQAFTTNRHAENNDNGAVYYHVVGTAPYRQFIIEWNGRNLTYANKPVTFQMILYETTNNIKFQYQDVVVEPAQYSNGAEASIGIRGDPADGSDYYVQYAYKQAILSDGLAVCFQYPGSPPCDEIPTLQLTDSLACLTSLQEPSGAWNSERSGLAERDTAAALAAYATTGTRTLSSGRAISWLAGRVSSEVDLNARVAEALAMANFSDFILFNRLNQTYIRDGFWGSTANTVNGSPFDTALALLAVKHHPQQTLTSSDISRALSYLNQTQQPAGGWQLTPGLTTVQATATSLMALGTYRTQFNLQASINAAVDYLATRQQADGAFGDGTGTVEETALAMIALTMSGPSTSGAGSNYDEMLERARIYLLNSKQGDGCWENQHVYATALAIRALALQAPTPQIDDPEDPALQTTRLSGTVLTDPDGQPIYNATLTLGDAISATTDLEGTLFIPSLPAGFYTFEVSALGYQTAIGQINVIEGSNNSIEVKLPAAPVQPIITVEPVNGWGGDGQPRPFREREELVARVSFPTDVDIEEYIWQTSDGQSKQLAHPDEGNWYFAFPDNATYMIYLDVLDRNGNWSQAQTSIQVENVPPDVTVYVDDNRWNVEAFVNQPVKITASIDNDYPDSTYGFFGTYDMGMPNATVEWVDTVAPEITWAYTQTGTYTIKLTAEDKDGGIASDEITVEVKDLSDFDHPYTAAFEATTYAYDESNNYFNNLAVPPQPIYEGNVVLFKDTTENIQYQDGWPTNWYNLIQHKRWEWNISDGFSSPLRNMPRRFDDNGTFDVTLTVESTAGVVDTSDPLTLEVLNLPPMIALSDDQPQTLPVGTEIDFGGRIADPSPIDDQSLTVSWDFGDGTTTSERNPKHTWTSEGTYTVRVSATDKDGATTTVNATVRVLPTDSIPFTRIMPATNTNLTRDANGILSVSRGINTSEIFNTATIYPDGLHATERQFQQRSRESNNTWKDQGGFQGSISTGSGIGNQPWLGLTHLRMIETYNNGEKAVAETLVRVTPEQLPDWQIQQIFAAPGAPVHPFTPTTYLYYSMYDWDDEVLTHKDTNNGLGADVKHIYGPPGTYQPRLYAASTDGVHFDPPLTGTVWAGINANAVADFTLIHPISGFNYTNYYACGSIDNLPDEMNALSITQRHLYDSKQCYFAPVNPYGLTDPTFGSSYSTDGSKIIEAIWDFGDGSEPVVKSGSAGALSNVYHTFADSGNYSVTLTIRTNTGLQSSVAKNVLVYNDPPTADVGEDRTLLMNETVTLDAIGSDISVDDFQNLYFAWDFGDGNSFGTYNEAPGFASTTHAWSAPGTYTVTLTVWDDADSATDTAIYTIIENQRPFVSSVPPDTAFVGEEITYQVVAEDSDNVPAGTDPLSYTLALAPDGMTIGDDGLITWTPDVAQTGYNLGRIVVEDSRGARVNHFLNIQVFEQPPTADLIVTGVDTTGFAVDPQRLIAEGTLAASIKNQGLISATMPFSVTFFEDTTLDGEWTPGEDTLLNTANVPALATGDTTSVTVQIAPTSVLFRDNLVYALVDSGDQIFEDQYETNNLGWSGLLAAVTAQSGEFAARLEWAWRGADQIPPSFYEDDRWASVISTPVVAPLVDTNGDLVINEQDVPAIIFVSHSDNNYLDSKGMLHAIRGDTGEPIFTQTDITNAAASGGDKTTPAVGDLEGDGKPDIVTIYSDSTCLTYSADDSECVQVGSSWEVRAFSNNGRLKWKTERYTDWSRVAGSPLLADIDADGDLEIFAHSTMFDHTGQTIWDWNNGAVNMYSIPYGGTGFSIRGAHGQTYRNGSYPAVADLDLDGQPELVTGATAYTLNGSGDQGVDILWNRYKYSTDFENSNDPTLLPDGAVGVANFDNDPFPEIASISQEETVYLLEHDGSTKWGPVEVCNGMLSQEKNLMGGGPPVIADFNGDGVPDVGVTGAPCFTAIDGVDGSYLWIRPSWDRWGGMGASAFDFDGDGSAEVLQMDQRFMRIFSGLDGTVLWQIPNASGTIDEYPIVADVDKDGQPEIIVPRNQYAWWGEEIGVLDSGIFVFGNPFNDWQPARSIWNSYHYHVTNVNEDGTIPAVAPNNWETYNNYRTQVGPAEPVQSAADLTASRLILDATGCPANLDVMLRVGNGGGQVAATGTTLALYRDSASEDNLIATTVITQAIQPGHFIDISTAVANPPIGSSTLLAVVNDSLIGDTTIPESRTDNNTHSATLDVCGPNVPPTITSSPLLTMTANTLYSYTVVLDDPDGAAPIFELPKAPAGATLDTSTGYLAWFIPDNMLGRYDFTIRVHDSKGGLTSQSFTVNVILPEPDNPTPLCPSGTGTPGTVEIPNNGIDDDCNPNTPDTVDPADLTVDLHTNRQRYGAYETVLLRGTLAHTGDASTYTGLEARLMVESSDGAILFDQTTPIAALEASGETMVTGNLNTGSNTPGTYTARIVVSQNGTDLNTTASTPFELVNELVLVGDLNATPRKVRRNDPYTVTWQASNLSSFDLSDVELKLLAIDPATDQILQTYQQNSPMVKGAILGDTLLLNAPATTISDTVLLMLQGTSEGETRTLASSGLLIAGTNFLTRTVLLVDANAQATEPDGQTWATAFPTLQDALAIATPLITQTVEIWVADGVYYPDEGTGQSNNDRSAAFNLRDRVEIYGGFTGWNGGPTPGSEEWNREQRDPTAYNTILSGDVAQDDASVGGVITRTTAIAGDNSYHVIRSITPVTHAVLDGFVITGGQANGPNTDQRYGGGLHLVDSKASLSNLLVIGNYAAIYGGGLYTSGGDPFLQSITFDHNTVDQSGSYGGGLYNENGAPVLIYAMFVGNQATGGYGGGLYSYQGHLALLNSLVAHNHADYGGGLYNDDGTVSVVNSTFASNQATGAQTSNRGGAIYNFASTLAITNTLIWGNVDDSGTGTPEASITEDSGSQTEADVSLVQGIDLTGSGSGNQNGTDPTRTPRFTNPLTATVFITRGQASGYQLRPGSAAIDTGTNGALPVVDDLAGNPRVVDGDTDGTAIIDLGPYEAPEDVVAPLCFNGIDVIQVLDGSASISTDDFQTMRAFARDIVAAFDIGTSGARVGVVQFSAQGTTMVETGLSADPAVVDAAITKMTPLAGSTDMQEGLATALDELVNDARPGVPQVIILLTDGKQTQGGNAVLEAYVAKRVGVNIFTIAVGDEADTNELQLIATQPASDYAFSVDAFDELSNLLSTLVRRACSLRNVLYVDRHAQGAADGSSWANAFPRLQDALAATDSAYAGTTEIWVADGVYYPDEGTGQSDNERSATFNLRDRVEIYGGFTGWNGGPTPGSEETHLSQRHPNSHFTILSGDIDQNDSQSPIISTTTTVEGTAANSHHVVTAASVDSSAVLDGVVITAGASDDNGGGLLSTSASPTLVDVVFRGNQAQQAGGGLFNDSGCGAPTLIDVRLEANLSSGSDGDGGGLFSACGDLTLTNVWVSGNQANRDGGGLLIESGSATLVNVLISGNQAGRSGGGVYANTSTLTLVNATVSGNRALDTGGGLFTSANTLTLVNSIVWGNSADNDAHQVTTLFSTSYSLIEGQNPEGTGNLDGTRAGNAPQFEAPVAADNAPTQDGSYKLQRGSAAIDAGDDAAMPAGTVIDLVGLLRSKDGDFNGYAQVDMGAYEAHLTQTYSPLPGTPEPMPREPDFNGDDSIDILWHDATIWQQGMWLLDMETRLSAGLLNVGISNEWRIAGLTDFDGDDKSDLLWRNTNDGRNVLWLMDGTSRKAGGVAVIHTVSDTAWEMVGVHDFDRDGNPDIFWRNMDDDDGRNVLWLMDGTSRKAAGGVAVIHQVSDQLWQLGGVGDFDGDGRLDIFWRHSTDGRNVIWFMDGTTRKGEGGIAVVNVVSDTTWDVMGVGDFNGDGRADIFWRNPTTGDNILWLMDGGTRAEVIALPQVSATGWDVAGIAPFNADDTADALWHNSTTGAVMLWTYEPGTGQQLGVLSLDSQGTNWDAVGMNGLTVQDDVALASGTVTSIEGADPQVPALDGTLSTPMPDEPPGAPMAEEPLSTPMPDEPIPGIPQDRARTSIYLPLIQK